MTEFFHAIMGHKFYESTMPRIATALEKIAMKLETPAPDHTLHPHLEAALKTAVEAYKGDKIRASKHLQAPEVDKAFQYIEGWLKGEEEKRKL